VPLLRPKQPAIYATVADWWSNTGGVTYIAHAVTNAGVFALGPITEGTGGTPTNHPDQAFWRTANSATWPPAASVLRIEIDCSLMPCNGQGGCLYAVPDRIKSIAGGKYKDTPLRIFSHRNEAVGATQMQNKRVIRCKATDAKTTLDQAYNAHENWFWVSTNDPRVDGREYHMF